MNHLIKFSWIGPLIFVLAILLFGFLNPGYSHISQYISELAADQAPNNRLMSYLGIVPFGLSIVLFSFAGMGLNKKNYLHLISFSILTITGLLFVAAGIFNCDQGCSFENMSQKAVIHNMSALTAFILLIISQLLAGLNIFRKGNKKAHLVNLGAGIIGILIFYAMLKTGYSGACFRDCLSLIPVFGWCWRV